VGITRREMLRNTPRLAGGVALAGGAEGYQQPHSKRPRPQRVSEHGREPVEFHDILHLRSAAGRILKAEHLCIRR
jgi:hypothetical protein